MLTASLCAMRSGTDERECTWASELTFAQLRRGRAGHGRGAEIAASRVDRDCARRSGNDAGNRADRRGSRSHDEASSSTILVAAVHWKAGRTAHRRVPRGAIRLQDARKGNMSSRPSAWARLATRIVALGDARTSTSAALRGRRQARKAVSHGSRLGGRQRRKPARWWRTLSRPSIVIASGTEPNRQATGSLTERCVRALEMANLKRSCATVPEIRHALSARIRASRNADDTSSAEGGGGGRRWTAIDGCRSERAVVAASRLAGFLLPRASRELTASRPPRTTRLPESVPRPSHTHVAGQCECGREHRKCQSIIRPRAQHAIYRDRPARVAFALLSCRSRREPISTRRVHHSASSCEGMDSVEYGRAPAATR